ncbi:MULTISPECIES: toll/interleukin-1 receptor domain-containing protein [Streptomyces]|uniref:TIR domain-containing protein n=1 Tax=Streptomyces cheonanensis TaxID=312720 RepID=A0ABN2UQP5_9ACTN|nr:toll/interleukin-1 receptor domain-containing protein [Streptomyces ginkgonis]
MSVAPEVFVNYRTGDAEMAAALVQRELAHRFGPDHVFFASRSIAPGTDYTHGIEDALRRCRVLLAVIGPRWAERSAERAPGPAGQQRDWAHHEILRAREYDIPVLPVLVGRETPRLRATDLPEDLAFLTERQYMRLDHRNAAVDLERIADEVLHCAPTLTARDSGIRPTSRHGHPGPAGGACYHFDGDLRGAHLYFWSR